MLAFWRTIILKTECATHTLYCIKPAQTALQLNLQSATREVEILTDKELDYARQSHYKTKEIATLRRR